MNYSIRVKKDEARQRLDVFLALLISNKSRSHIQKCIKNGEVKVNDSVVTKAGYLIQTGEVIQVEFEEEPTRTIKIKPKKMPIDVIYKDVNLAVVNKKAGIPVHPGAGNWNNTLINGLIYKFRELSKVGKPSKFGLIHRIDKDTSGLVMIALDDEALWYYSRLFEKREVIKLYLALVSGDICKSVRNKKRFTITNYIARHPRNRKEMAVVDKDKGRLATTVFYPLDAIKYDKLGVISVLLVQPKTGRTHQIRVHLKHLSHPILGDSIYGKDKFVDKKSISRMFLHAYFLRCRMLDGKTGEFRAPIPDEFTSFFEKKSLIKGINCIIKSI